MKIVENEIAVLLDPEERLLRDQLYKSQGLTA